MKKKIKRKFQWKEKHIKSKKSKTKRKNMPKFGEKKRKRDEYYKKEKKRISTRKNIEVRNRKKKQKGSYLVVVRLPLVFYSLSLFVTWRISFSYLFDSSNKTMNFF